MAGRIAALFLLGGPLLWASLILDRAPEAGVVGEIFIDEDGVRVEWELDEGETAPELSVDSSGPKARRLTLVPPATIGEKDVAVVVYHRGLPVSDLQYLTQDETLELDWEDPWRSHFLNPRLRRGYDSPVGVFLHVGRYEVRVEILGRPADFGIERIVPGRYTDQVAAFLEGRWQLSLDGEVVSPPLDRCQFLERRLRVTTAIEPPAADRVRSSTLGIVYRLRRDRLPQEVELTWTAFPPGLSRLSAAVTEDFFMEPAVILPGSNVLRWSRSGAEKDAFVAPVLPVPEAALPGYVVPASGLLLAVLLFRMVRGKLKGRALSRIELAGAFVLGVVLATAVVRQGRALEERVAQRIVEGLLKNAYHAFDYPEDSAIYDALAASIAGDYLTEAFLEVHRALEVERTGGAAIKVNEVQVDETETRALEGRHGFRSDARWTVAGAVAHWGHIHTRQNRYSGTITVEPVDGVWKITALKLRDEQRLH